MTDPSPPSSELSLLVRDQDGKLRLLRSANGASFEEAPAPEGVSTGLPPALCRLEGGGYFAAFVAEDGRVMAGVSADGAAFDWREVPGAKTSHPPAVATWKGALCLAVTGEDERLYLARAEGPSGLALAPAHPDATTSCGPSLAATASRLYLAFTSQHGPPYVATTDDGLSVALNELTFKPKTSVETAIASVGNHIYLMVRGDDRGLYLACSNEGPGLSFRRVGGEAITDAAPSLSASAGTLRAVITGTDHALYAGSLEGGEVWFSPVEGAPSTSQAPAVAGPAPEPPSEPARSRVTVAFFVPEGGSFDDERIAASTERVNEHLELAQRRYREWLGNDTFAFDPEPRVVRGKRPLARYKGDEAWEQIADEVFAEAGENRFTSLRVFVALFVRPDDYEYAGTWKQMGCAGEAGGEGVGMVLMEYKSLFDDEPYPFQSTLVHELGHAFGLPHSSDWGEDMDTGVSIMSYNPRHHTKGLELGELAGELLPQELDHLAQNELVFPDFER